jgi:hypothetical protein
MQHLCDGLAFFLLEGKFVCFIQGKGYEMCFLSFVKTPVYIEMLLVSYQLCEPNNIFEIHVKKQV